MAQSVDDMAIQLARCRATTSSSSSDLSDSLEYSMVYSFPKFPELPTELRLRIWRYLIPESRIVDVEVYEQYLNSGSLGWRQIQNQIVVRNHWNPICLVNHESRDEFLKKYTTRPNRQFSLPQFRIDPVDDVLYLGEACFSKKGPPGLMTQKTESLHHAMSPELRQSILHIALPFNSCHEVNFPWLFRSFPALRRFTMVFSRPENWPGLKNAELTFCPDSEGIPIERIPALRQIEDRVQSYWRTNEGKGLFKERGFKPLLSIKWLAYCGY